MNQTETNQLENNQMLVSVYKYSDTDNNPTMKKDIIQLDKNYMEIDDMDLKIGYYDILNILEKIYYTVDNIEKSHTQLPQIDISDRYHESRRSEFLILNTLSNKITTSQINTEQNYHQALPVFECIIKINDTVLSFTRTCDYLYIKQQNSKMSCYVYVDKLYENNKKCIKSSAFSFNMTINDQLGIYQISNLDKPYNSMNKTQCKIIKKLHSHDILTLIDNFYKLMGVQREHHKI